MHWQTIEKRRESARVAPNLWDYDGARASFSWERVRAELAGLPGGRGLNIAHEAVDRHAAGPRRDYLALRWLGRRGAVRDYSYAELRALTNRFANVLQGLGIAKGDRVFGLAGRIPELYIAALGTLKQGAVFCPLFSAFGPEPIAARMRIGEGRVLVTTEGLYRRKVEGIRGALPHLQEVLLVGEGGEATEVAGTRDLPALLAAASEAFEIPSTDPEDMALLHFTSGTTGTPKGAIHVHQAVLMHYLTGKLALDLHPDDRFWCTADPGWVTGTSYGIIAPLVNGVTSLVDEEEFDAERWYRTLQDQRVTVWYTAPTAIRLLMKAGTELALRVGWPSMFRGYLHEEERYRQCFADGYYLTGDLAWRDGDGYFWFVGRADDVIKSAGHLIGPFEVGSVPMEHPTVAEAGVIGTPDTMAGEVVKAFVALKPGFASSEALRKELLGLARKRLGAAIAPREIDFRPSLPKTRSGKIMRRLLKARELGLPEGDLSTLEEEK